jgi:hypothetical protein
VATGITTLLVTVACVAAASAGIATVPRSASTPTPSVSWSDNVRRELDAGAFAGLGARFRTIWVMLTFIPAAVSVGVAVTEVTLRSGRLIAIGAVRVLLASLDSSTTLRSSATAIRKYDPAAVPAGMVSVVAPAEMASLASEGMARVAVSRTSPASKMTSGDR